MVERAAKVFHTPSRRYYSARTRDVSGGGMLIEVDCPRAINPGERVEVGVQWFRRAIIEKSSMRGACVVRTYRDLNDRLLIGVVLDAAQAGEARAA